MPSEICFDVMQLESLPRGVIAYIAMTSRVLLPIWWDAVPFCYPAILLQSIPCQVGTRLFQVFWHV